MPGREAEYGFGVATRVGVQVRAAPDDVRTPVHRVAEQGEPVGPRAPGERPGDGDDGQVHEPAQ